MNLEIFCSLPPVLEALKNPRSSRSVLNYMCACDTSDPVVRESLNTDEKVEPLPIATFNIQGSLLKQISEKDVLLYAP